MGFNGFLFNANPERGDSVRGFLDFHNGFLTGSSGVLFNANPESGDSVTGFLDFHHGFLTDDYTGLRYTGRPDQKGARLGLSGDVLAETIAGMAVVIASSGPISPILATQFALGVILASWFPIQVELCTLLGAHMGQGAYER